MFLSSLPVYIGEYKKRGRDEKGNYLLHFSFIGVWVEEVMKK